MLRTFVVICRDRDGKRQTVTINASDRETARGIMAKHYPGWKIISILEHR